MEWYHSEQIQKAWVSLQFRNDGITDAKSISVTATLEFREKRPRPSYKFVSSDVIGMIPTDHLSQYDPIKRAPAGYITSKKISIGRSPRLYVWGEFSYRDFVGDKQTGDFCRYVSRNQLLDAQSVEPGKEAGGGYKGQYEECEP
jgi:hypothetical protein